MLMKRAFSEAGRTGPMGMVLLVDQLEELFTTPGLSTESVETFFKALQALATSSSVRVLATVRSDFYDRCQTSPTLMVMKEGRGQMDLLPPDPSDLHRIITGPAAMAGVFFEKGVSGETLDQRILNDSAGHPEALPLLEFTLETLYENRTAEGKLTFKQYEMLGGIEGSIGRHADSVFDALPGNVRDEFGTVFNALVALDESKEAHPVRRYVPVAEVTDTPERKQLVDTLVDARLLISDYGEVAVAHEALLRRWHRVVQWIDVHRDFLRVRDQVVQRMGQGGVLLAGDPLFDLARVELTEHRFLFTLEQIAFIENAIAAAERKQQRSRRIRNAVMSSLTALTLVALVAMGWALSERNNAEKHRIVAEEKTADAEARLGQARHNLGLAYILRAEQEIVNKSYNGARLFALHALNNLKPEAYYKANTLIANHPINPVVFSSPPVVHHSGYVASVSFSPDGLTLSSGSGDKTIKLWDVATGKEKATLKGHSREVTSVSFSPDGKTLSSGSFDNTIKLWDVATGKEKATLKGYSGEVTSVNYSSDGKTLASGSEDGTIKLWDVATDKEKATLTGHSGEVTSVNYSSDGKTLASGSRDKTIKLWDVATGKEKATLTGHSDDVNSVSYSPDGLTLASGSGDKTIKLWYVATGKEKATLTGHSGYVTSVSYSPDGLTLASGSGDKTIKLWDVATGKEKATLTGHSGEVTSVSFSPDGKTLASGSMDNAIKLWDVAMGKEKATLEGHLGDVASVSYSPDGKTLASGSWDDTIKLWDVTTGKEKVVLTGHSEPVTSVSYSPDGQTLASGSGYLGNGNNTIRLWDVALLSDTEPIESMIRQAEYSFHLSVEGFDLVPVESTPTNLYHNTITLPQWPKTLTFHWLSSAEAGDAEAMVELGIIYDRDNDLDNARYWYEKAISASSERGKKRLEVFMQCFTRDKENRLGEQLQIQWEKSDWQAVIETCTAWIELNPENADAYWNRGHAFFKQGQYAPAEADYRKVSELVPDFGDAQGILAWVLILQGRFSDALAPAQKANALAPESYELAINLGHVHLMLGDAREAESQYVKTIPLLPDEAALQAGPLADFDIFIKNGWQPEACRKWRQWFEEVFARHKAG